MDCEVDMGNTVKDKETLPELLSTAQTAEVLQVTPRMVSAMCSSGKLKAVRVGKLWRVNRDALFEFAGLR